jgi:hypothetical protein
MYRTLTRRASYENLNHRLRSVSDPVRPPHAPHDFIVLMNKCFLFMTIMTTNRRSLAPL